MQGVFTIAPIFFFPALTLSSILTLRLRLVQRLNLFLNLNLYYPLPLFITYPLNSSLKASSFNNCSRLMCIRYRQ